MQELLDALGWEKGALGGLHIVAVVTAVSVSLALGGYVLDRVTGTPDWLLQLVLWVPWLAWLRWIFPRQYGRDCAYRAAFFRQVIPGISWNFAQMARPVLVGLMSSGRPLARPWLTVTGLVVATGGYALVIRAVRTIGISRALFVGEYLPASRQLVTDGVYRVLRHPMFVGGMTISVGLSLVVWSRGTLAMDLATLAVLPWYRVCEDARCRAVHATYDGYRGRVSGLVPRRPARLATLGRGGAPFSQDPSYPRNDAR